MSNMPDPIDPKLAGINIPNPTQFGAEGDNDQHAKEAYFTASQGQLIWARFKKQRAAMIAAFFLVFLIFSGLFAPFLSPYDPTVAGRNKDYTNGAPQIPQFCDKNGCSLRPFIHPVERERSLATNFRWVTKINEDKRSYLTFLPKGDAYKLFGVIKSDRHLFGLEEGKIHVFGTDEDGQDIFSRTLHAIWTSLQVGTIGVLIAFVLALIIGGVSGYYGGWIDSVIQMITDAFRTVPAIPLFMAVAAFMPPEISAEARFFLYFDYFGLYRVAYIGTAYPNASADRAKSRICVGCATLRRVLVACNSTSFTAVFYQLHYCRFGNFLSLYGTQRNRSFLYWAWSERSSFFAWCNVAKGDICRCYVKLSMVFYSSGVLYRSGYGVRFRRRRVARCC